MASGFSRTVSAAAFKYSSNVFGSAGVIGAANLRDTSSSTSGVERVSYSGRMTGPNLLGAAFADPLSGAASTHDSRNE